MISPPSSTSVRTVPGRHCAVEFHALPSRIGQVRRIVSAQLRYWRLDPLIDAAALGVTELLANVHRHASSDKHCTVEITFGWDRLTVAVRDHDPRLPRVRTRPRDARDAREARDAAEDGGEDGMATSGRGLALIAALSESWGMRAQHDGSGKTVWFSLPAVPAPPPGSPARPAAPLAAAAPLSASGPAGPPTAAAPRERQPSVTSAV